MFPELSKYTNFVKRIRWLGQLISHKISIDLNPLSFLFTVCRYLLISRKYWLLFAGAILTHIDFVPGVGEVSREISAKNSIAIFSVTGQSPVVGHSCCHKREWRYQKQTHYKKNHFIYRPRLHSFLTPFKIKKIKIMGQIKLNSFSAELDLVSHFQLSLSQYSYSWDHSSRLSFIKSWKYFLLSLNLFLCFT